MQISPVYQVERRGRIKRPLTSGKKYERLFEYVFYNNQCDAQMKLMVAISGNSQKNGYYHHRVGNWMNMENLCSQVMENGTEKNIPRNINAVTNMVM